MKLNIQTNQHKFGRVLLPLCRSVSGTSGTPFDSVDDRLTSFRRHPHSSELFRSCDVVTDSFEGAHPSDKTTRHRRPGLLRPRLDHPRERGGKMEARKDQFWVLLMLSAQLKTEIGHLQYWHCFISNEEPVIIS